MKKFSYETRHNIICLYCGSAEHVEAAIATAGNVIIECRRCRIKEFPDNVDLKEIHFERAAELFQKLRNYIALEEHRGFTGFQNIKWMPDLAFGFKRPTFPEFLEVYNLQLTY